MDETGARVGCPKGEEVVVPTELKELYTSSPENRLSVTIIEAICADGSKPIPPVIICPCVRIMESWFRDGETFEGGELGDETQHLYAVSPTNLQYPKSICRAKLESVEMYKG